MQSKLFLYILVLLPEVLFSQKANFGTVEIDSIIKQQMKESGIPGLAVVVYSGGREIYKKGYGFADTRLKTKVNTSTVFELGSNSKAFTALGIFYLQKTGRLSLDDQVTKYLPWFYAKYKGAKIRDFTVRQFLHHKSGIPFGSIDLIREGEGENELDSTIRRLAGIALRREPGTGFEYATINYDVLGLIIEKVSRRPYEQFMQEAIFSGLGLAHTSAGKDTGNVNSATGYKWDFLKLEEYKAPVFRANTPAGYIYSDIDDIGKWLGRNINITGKNLFDSLIQQGHDRGGLIRSDNDNTFYGGGWYVNDGGLKRVFHNGANPNFSSFIGFDRSSGNGVAILCNLNSAYIEKLGVYILDRLEGRPRTRIRANDTYKNTDLISFMIMIFSGLLISFTLFFIVTKFIYVIREKVKFYSNEYLKKTSELLFSIILILCIGYGLYLIPIIIYDNVSWSFLAVWAPFSLLVAIKTLYGSIILFFAYFIATFPFNKRVKDHLFSLAVLSILSGWGNALVIFSINSGLRGIDHSWSRFSTYFLLGLSIYMLTQRIIRIRLINVSNNTIYEKRKEISKILLMAPYEKVESMPHGEVITVLNNDTMAISRLPNVLVGFITSIVTILFCLIYLSVINIYAFFGSLFVFILAVTLYVKTNNVARKYLEKNRNIQGSFMQFISDLIHGLKELKISRRKGDDFMQDMNSNSDAFRQTNAISSIKFANTYVVGELLFSLVVGSVVFLLPLYLVGATQEDIRNFVFVFLYIAGPVNSILHSFPDLMGIRIAMRRINKLKASVLNWNETRSAAGVTDKKNDFQLLEIRDLEYEYANKKNDSNFKVGPISCKFKPGEITFIVGANGSGKSTLGKLLSGLYEPSNGTILINNCKVEENSLSEYYSVIFSDYYLFDKLYGIDSEAQKEQIDEKLAMLKLDEKVSIKDGAFSTSRLSSGQRKRLALLISYLENKSICLFDEWAADQDPEFRKFFYESLLMDLKKLNKCVIIATHDDRYFDIADKIIALEAGKIVEVVEPTNRFVKI